MELSYFEIYNERVRCLLNPDTQKKDLRVREHPITGPFVEDLTSYIVEDYEDVLKWMTVGNQVYFHPVPISYKLFLPAYLEWR